MEELEKENRRLDEEAERALTELRAENARLRATLKTVGIEI